MSRMPSTCRFVVLAAFAVALSVPLAGQENEPFQDVVGWHVVEPGESLESITERYLGAAELWYANWRLNPQLRDPHQIFPGQRIRVITERQVPARSALLEEVANDVDKNPRRSGWQDALRGDELEAPSGIRTGRASSALVNFDEGTRVTLTEWTQVFLKEMSTGVTGKRHGEIEVEVGQADLVMAPRRKGASDIEILVGDTVMRPAVGVSGRAETRARRPERGGSELMVYGGSSEVEAGGQAVSVATGMGTTVPEGGVPAPPEKLLARPRLTAPPARSAWAFRNPELIWQPVAGAASYTVEICRDRQCATLAARHVGEVSTAWRPDRLDDGTYHARVTAVAPSGLDGYPSQVTRFTIATTGEHPFDHVDTTPPTVAALVVGAGGTEGDRIVLGPGGRLRLVAHDDASGIERVRYRWNDGRWQTWTDGQPDIAPPAAEATLTVDAVDVAGRMSEPWSVTVMRHDRSPEPPSVGGSRR